MERGRVLLAGERARRARRLADLLAAGRGGRLIVTIVHVRVVLVLVVELSLDGYIPLTDVVADDNITFLTAFLALICAGGRAVHSGLIVTIAILTLAKEAILCAGVLKVGLAALRRGLAAVAAARRRRRGAAAQGSAAIAVLLRLLLLHDNGRRLNSAARELLVLLLDKHIWVHESSDAKRVIVSRLECLLRLLSQLLLTIDLRLVDNHGHLKFV